MVEAVRGTDFLSSRELPIRDIDCVLNRKMMRCQIMYAFYGTHVISDFYGISKSIAPESFLEQIAMSCIKNGVTLLSSRLHIFENGGFTICCLLAESHISVHYYIEERSAFLDVFTCGNSKPEDILSDLKDYCMPQDDYTLRIVRGIAGE